MKSARSSIDQITLRSKQSELQSKEDVAITFPDALLSEKQAAPLMGIDHKTLAQWRWRGIGPAYVKVSARCVRYRRSDIDAWIAANLVRPFGKEAA